MRLFVLGLLFCFSVSSLTFAETAKEYFDKASLEYLSGDFINANKNLDKVLELKPGHVGALKLKKIIARDSVLNPVPVVVSPEVQSVEAVPSVVVAPSAPISKRKIFAIGSLAFLFGFIIFLPRIFRRIRIRGNHCFSCGARVTQNIDLCPKCGAWVGTKLRASISKEQRDWYKKSGWRKNPFTLEIHPELFTGHREEVKDILEKISSMSGHILITGSLGAGKTTLLRWLASYLTKEYQPVYIARPPQQFSQITNLIAESLDVPAKKAAEYDIYHLNRLRQKTGKRLVMLMDEAHEFTVELERPLRTLGDLDGVILVMAGLPETINKMQKEIQPLYERLVLDISLKNLDLEDVHELIKNRIENAGGQGIKPFTEKAVEAIFEKTKGNPRLVVKYCDWAVTRAINLNEDKIKTELLEAFETEK